jgi:SH3 domain-containing YSC84-like protein 1
MIDRRTTLLLGLAGAAAVALPSSAQAATVEEAQDLVDEARIAMQQMLRSAELEALPRYIRSAKALLILPSLFRAGFIFGGEGGQGVMLARNADGSWGYPAFYGVGGGSIGLQIGGQVSQVALTIMTDRGFLAIQESNFTVGADIGGSIATVGLGVEARTGMAANADMYAFSLSQGLFAGGTLDGTVITELPDYNDAYYGFGTPARVIFEGARTNPGADQLRSVLPR